MNKNFYDIMLFHDKFSINVYKKMLKMNQLKILARENEVPTLHNFF